MASSSAARSASNTDRKTSASQSRRTTTAGATSDRRVERNTILTRETITVRNRSPVRQFQEQQSTIRKSRDAEKPAPPKQEAKKKEPESKSMCRCHNLEKLD